MAALEMIAGNGVRTITLKPPTGSSAISSCKRPGGSDCTLMASPW
jgi:hypothetical protein